MNAIGVPQTRRHLATYKHSSTTIPSKVVQIGGLLAKHRVQFPRQRIPNSRVSRISSDELDWLIKNEKCVEIHSTTKSTVLTYYVMLLWIDISILIANNQLKNGRWINRTTIFISKTAHTNTIRMLANHQFI